MSEINAMPEPLLHSAGPRGLYVRTFGCQMNEYDSLRVQRLLANLGYVPVNDIGQADVIFLNTCSVRGKAEQKVHSFLGSLRRLKETKPHLKIIAGGCVAQQLGEKLLDRFDHLDMVIGTRAVNSVGQLLQRVQESGGRLACVPDEESGGLETDGRKISAAGERNGPGYNNAGLQQLLLLLHSPLCAGSGTEQADR